MVESGGAGIMAGRLEDEHAFKQGYFETLLVALSIPRVNGHFLGRGVHSSLPNIDLS